MNSPIFILGMHRSGTSAIAGTLDRLGYSFGSNLVMAKPGVNDRGFFEDNDVLALHEALFASWGRDWRYPLPPPKTWLEDAISAGYLEKIQPLIDRLGTEPKWALKDPRLCYTLPLWCRALEPHEIEPQVIIALRSPAAVARSLLARDELAVPIGTLMWTHHMIHAERATRELTRMTMNYDDLIDHPRKTLLAVCHRLGLDAPEDRLNSAMSFITPALRHEGDGDDGDVGDASVLWQLLNTTGIDGDGAKEALDRLYDQYEISDDLLGPALQAQSQRIAMWENEFSESDRQLGVVGSALTDQQSGLENAMRQLQALNKSVESYRKALRDQETGFTQAVESVKRRDQTISELQLERDRLKADLASQSMRTVVEAGGSQAQPVVPDHESTYHGVIDLRVDNNSHTRVIRYVREAGSPDRGPILDVGCSSGYFGEALKKLGYQVWGIEPHPTAAVEASKRLDQVYSGSIETFLADPVISGGAKFQFVIFGDVLEHVIDPVGILKACCPLLGSEGRVIASIPNVAHKSVRFMLMEGRWDYAESGILDRTHLHFYTRDSLVSLLDDAGCRIERFSAVTLNVASSNITVTPRIEDAFDTLIHDHEQDAFQFIVMAAPEADANVREEANRKYMLRGHHRILCVPPLKESNLCSIRLADPLTRLAEMYGGEFRVEEPHLVSGEDAEWADTIVFQRESNPRLLEMMRRFRKAGKRVIFDIDDLLTDVPEYLSVAAHCREIKPYLESALREADAVSVSTAELREALLPYNPRTFITPNYAWSNEQPIAHDETEQPIRIIVASSDSVRVDFLVDSLRNVVDDPADNVELVGIGPPGEYLVKLGLPVICFPTMDHPQFKSFLVQNNNTIALIPLDDNRFNRCKSAIKFFDYALAGVPCICSAVVPYYNVIDDPENGILCLDNEVAWTSAIRALVHNTAMRQSIANNARQRCLDMHNLDRTAASWEELLRETAFPQGDPVYEYMEINQRTSWELLRGTVRHIVTPASYAGAWQALRSEGLRGLWGRWKTVF